MNRNLRELASLYQIQPEYQAAGGAVVTASDDALRTALEARIGSSFDVDDALRERQQQLAAPPPVRVIWQGDPFYIDNDVTLESGERWDRTRPLPPGYHTSGETLLISAPRRAFEPGVREWGIFAPLYAARTKRTWGAGDLGDLEAYRLWVNELGGGIVATLPMLTTFHESDPSPYSPVSRLFWNELFLDVERLPEYRGESLPPLPLAGDVNYAAVIDAKRAVLERLAERAEITSDARINDYAEFRAARGGGSARYHRYVQTRMNEQMRTIADDARERGLGLYLDFPLGVNAGGYDAHRFAHLFAKHASVGAPPDLFFTKGQNWGFPPLDPDAIRRDHHRYFRDCIRFHMSHAGILRLDHVMGLHRLFWIPEGGEAKDGVYVRYPAEELWAILTIESQRHRCVVVGEDLGTVPEEVPRAMDEHGVRRMFVVQYELNPDAEEPVKAPARESIASINTHDMPTFAGFWREKDVDMRIEQQLLDERGARAERETRQRMRESFTQALKARGLLEPQQDDTVAVLEAVLRFLGASDAEIVLVNLEDLWLEPEPQNVPGTSGRSWRRRMRLGLDEARHDATVRRLLRTVNQTRRQDDGDQK